MNLDQIKACCTTKDGKARAEVFGPFLMSCGLSGAPFQMFLAQLLHESGEFRYVKELASGQAYEGRKDLGNNHPGDGVKYKGRGLIQITGRANYEKCGKALGLELIDHPELLEQPAHAVSSAVWFWHSKGLSELATRGDYMGITKRINGGTNGWADRLACLERVKRAFA